MEPSFSCNKFSESGECKRCLMSLRLHKGPLLLCPDQQLSLAQRPAEKKGHPRFHEIVRQMSDLHNKKNTDYAEGMAEGPLGNFDRVSKIMRLYPGMDWASPFGVCIVYMLKQFDAGLVLKSQRRESTTNEPVMARLLDIAVYAVLEIILDEAEHVEKETKTEQTEG